MTYKIIVAVGIGRGYRLMISGGASLISLVNFALSKILCCMLHNGKTKPRSKI